jgi:DDE superfamily endonuclease
VASIFVAFEPLVGWRHVAVTDSRRRSDWAHFVEDLLEGPYREAPTLVLVMDQLNTHSPASLYEAFAPDKAQRLAERLEIHYTPKHGSWLNRAEIELSVLSRDLPERIGSRAALERHVSVWEQRRNRSGSKANWQFTTADARTKLRKLYPTVEG